MKRKVKWVEKEGIYGEKEGWEANEGDWYLLVVRLEEDDGWEWRVTNRYKGDWGRDIADSREDAMSAAEKYLDWFKQKRRTKNDNDSVGSR